MISVSLTVASDRLYTDMPASAPNMDLVYLYLFYRSIVTGTLILTMAYPYTILYFVLLWS